MKKRLEYLKVQTDMLRKRGIFLLLICLGLTGLWGCGCSEKEKWEDSIFSWNGGMLLKDQEDKVQYAMDKLGCRAIYQEIPHDAEDEVVLDFLARRSAKGQQVYYLAGQAEWGLEKDAESMKAVVRTVVDWNKAAGENQGFEGIVWDVEPYLLDEWDEDKEWVMNTYVANCITAFGEAAAEGLKVITCIPNFYDRSATQKGLEALIKSGCDAIAVMNYNKSDESGQIEEETRLVKKYGKGILNIAELQKPGYHDLTEINTYYYDGIEAVKESFAGLKERFDYSGMGFSWHYLDPVLEIMEREQQS